MRWKLLDEVIEICPKHSAHAKAEFPSSEASWQTLVIEMMAQLGGLIVGAETDFSKDVIFAKIEKVIYHGEILNPSKLDVHAFSDQVGIDGGWINGVVSQQGHKICEAKMLLMNVGALNDQQSESMTFHSQFMDYYHIREKVKC